MHADHLDTMSLIFIRQPEDETVIRELRKIYTLLNVDDKLFLEELPVFINTTHYVPPDAEILLSRARHILPTPLSGIPFLLDDCHGSVWTTILGSGYTVDIGSCIYVPKLWCANAHSCHCFKIYRGEMLPVRSNIPEMTLAITRVLQSSTIPELVFDFLEEYMNMTSIETTSNLLSRPLWLFFQEFCTEPDIQSDKKFILRENRLFRLQEWKKLRYEGARKMLTLHLVEKIIVAIMYRSSDKEFKREDLDQINEVLTCGLDMLVRVPSPTPVLPCMVEFNKPRNTNRLVSYKVVDTDDWRHHFKLHEVRIFKYIAVEFDYFGHKKRIQYIFTPRIKFFNKFLSDIFMTHVAKGDLRETFIRIKSKLSYPKDYFFEYDPLGLGFNSWPALTKGVYIECRPGECESLRHLLESPEDFPCQPCTPTTPLHMMLEMYCDCCNLSFIDMWSSLNDIIDTCRINRFNYAYQLDDSPPYTPSL